MKIIIMYATAGHGHKKAAEYLYQELMRRKEAGAQLDVQMVDLFSKTPPAFVKTYPESYRIMVTHFAWFWGFAYWLTNIKWVARLVRPFRRIYNGMNDAGVRKFFIDEQADVLLFTHFFPPEVAVQLKKEKKIASRIVTVITDCFPHFTWINPGTDEYVVMADASKDAVASWNVPRECIHVCGLPVGEQFTAAGDKQKTRMQLGVSPQLFTVLLTSGSFGIGPTEKILAELNAFAGHVQALVVCGNNAALCEKLKSQTFRYPVQVFGFVSNMHELMDAADIVIAKSGGITMTESLARIIPMVISRPIPGQEAGNAQFLLSHDCAFSINGPEDVVTVVERIIQDNAVLENKRNHIRQVRKPNATKDIIDVVMGIAR